MCLISLFVENVVLQMALNLAGSPAFLSILGARLLFNMKEAGEKGLNPGTSCCSKSTVTNMFFEVPPVAESQSNDKDAGVEIIELEEIC